MQTWKCLARVRCAINAQEASESGLVIPLCNSTHIYYLLSISSLPGFVLDTANIKMPLFFRSLKLIQGDWHKPGCNLVWPGKYRELHEGRTFTAQEDDGPLHFMLTVHKMLLTSLTHLFSWETYEVKIIIHILLMRKLRLRELKWQSHSQLAGQQGE